MGKKSRGLLARLGIDVPHPNLTLTTTTTTHTHTHYCSPFLFHPALSEPSSPIALCTEFRSAPNSLPGDHEAAPHSIVDLPGPGKFPGLREEFKI